MNKTLTYHAARLKRQYHWEGDMGTEHYGRKHIGIIGADIAALHLGLRLRQRGIDCTIITDRSPDQVAAGPLMDTVVHWPATLGRERVLRVYHWPAEEFGFHEVHQIIQTPQPIEIRNWTVMPARAIDYRIYLPTLMEEFAERGGRLEVAPVETKDIASIAERFDLVVVAMPGNGFADLFARDPALSPYDRPQRYWLAGLFVGFRLSEMRGAILSIAPDRGEAVAFPLLSRRGMVGARHRLTALRRACHAARPFEPSGSDGLPGSAA
jgi:hypothetical protein